jgi:hypothetical protein
MIDNINDDNLPPWAALAAAGMTLLRILPYQLLNESGDALVLHREPIDLSDLFSC